MHWGLIGAAFVGCLAATIISFLRWRLLVRMLGLEFSLSDSLRLGFLGFIMNFFSLGAVGGDLFKAVLVAREQPGRRAEAVATVIVDRVIGLFALMLLASAAVCIRQTWQSENVVLRSTSQAVVAATSLVAIGLTLAFLPAFSGPRMVELLRRVPKAGYHAGRLLQAVALYRKNRGGLAAALGMSLSVHGLLTLSMHSIATGMFANSPALVDQLVACPLALLTGVLPLPLSGLGALEAVLDTLYPVLSPTSEAGEGLLVAFAYRGMTIAIALVGLAYYLSARKEMAAAMNSAGSQA